MLKEENLIPKEVKEIDTLYSSRFFKVVVIIFSVNLPELVLEVAEHMNFVQRMVKDSKGNVIIDLTKEGIEYAMGWSNKGIMYT